MQVHSLACSGSCERAHTRHKIRFNAIENKTKLFVWAGGPELKPFAQKKKVEELLSNFKEMQSKVYLPSLEKQGMFCFPLFCVIVF